MDIEGTYEVELTLRVFASIFNTETKFISTLGNDGWVSINPEISNSSGRVTLGHFAEGQGGHHVYLQREIAKNDESQQQDLDNVADNIVENNAE